MTYDENVPFEVTDLEVPPSNDQIGGDVIDAVKGIRFTISKVSLRQNDAKNIARLNVQCKVGGMGVDGEGKYTGKVIFAELLVYADTSVYMSEWWRKQARYPWKQFQVALSLDPAQTTRINDEFLGSLAGREFIADIRKSEMRQKGEDGKYVSTGDFKNELANFKKAE